MRPPTGKSAFVVRKTLFNRSVLRWYSRSAREFPWRGARDPYRVLVSEVMLQQTQVRRVAEKYPGFLRRFPSFSSLARASVSSVIRAWSGMGYNRRAVHLHRLATIVTTRFARKLPRNITDLESLPGIGKYTAHAVACFAFDAHVPVVDTNIRRVLGRVFSSLAKRTDIWDLAVRCLPQRRASDWNQALMDLGSTICTANNPDCASCPVSEICSSAFKVRKIILLGPNSEPSRDGLPDRIYRGRIVEALRRHPSGSRASIAQLGPRIKPSYTRRDEAWLVGLMKKLEEDGLVQLRHSRRGITASLAR